MDHETLPPQAQAAGRAIAFAPKWIEVTRIAPFCEELASFMNDECFQMTLGDSTEGLRHCLVSIEFNRDVPVGDPIRLQVRPVTRAVCGPPDGGDASLVIQRACVRDVDFTLLCGSDADDPGDFDVVVVTFLAIPVENGDPLAVHIDVHFVDGQTLARTFRGRLTSDSVFGVPASAREPERQ